jgi:integrase
MTTDGTESTAKRGKAKARGNGRGSIYTLPSGSLHWEIKLSGHKYGGTVKNKTEAERAISKTVTDHARGVLAAPDKVTLSDFTARVFARQKHLRPRSKRLYAVEMAYLLSVKLGNQVLGEIPVRDIRAQHLKDAFSILAEQKMKGSRGKVEDDAKVMSFRTLAKVLTRAKSIFREAVQEPLIHVSPAESLKPIRFLNIDQQTEAVGTTLDFEQLARFKEVGSALGEADVCRVWTLLFTMVSLGLRRGEACGLVWDDLDFKKGTLTVKRSRVSDNGAIIESSPKTPKSRRELVMPQSLIEALELHRAKQTLELGRCDLPRQTDAVFATSEGNWLHPSAVATGLRAILKWSDPKNLENFGKHLVSHTDPSLRDGLLATIKGGGVLPHLRPHDLRHTYATIALRSGVPIEVVSKNLGHAKISITWDIYRHVLESEQRSHAVDFFSVPVPKRPTQKRPTN